MALVLFRSHLRCFSLPCGLGDARGFLSGTWWGTESVLNWDVEEKLTKRLIYRGVAKPREPRDSKYPGVANSGKPRPLVGLRDNRRKPCNWSLGTVTATEAEPGQGWSWRGTCAACTAAPSSERTGIKTPASLSSRLPFPAKPPID